MENGFTIELSQDLYPPMLRELANPPALLHGRGDPSCLSEKCISIVGARRASPYGLAIAKIAGRVAAECGVVVVSGGAMGCDAAAARAAIAAGGKTVVVSGVGADLVYPSTSQDVYDGAIESGGAVISAEPWGQAPRRWAFPKRNAIIAALSKVLVVTEAGQRSGTMSTADMAIELDRIIYAIPGPIFSPNSWGTNSLANEGGRVIPDESSLEMAISMDYGVMRFASEQSGLSEGMGPVMSALLACPMRPDDLAHALGVEVLSVLRTLTDYEARDFVTRLPDGRYSPSEGFLLRQSGR